MSEHDTERHVDPYTLNGPTRLAGDPNVVFWRIDDLSEGRTGIDFLNHPAALVRGDEKLAEAVARAMNLEHRKRALGIGPGPGRDTDARQAGGDVLPRAKGGE